MNLGGGIPSLFNSDKFKFGLTLNLSFNSIMTKKDTINIGLVGFGMAGQVFHAPIISSIENLSLKAIQTTNRANIEIARERYPNAEIVGETSALLSSKEIDLIVVATPNHTHFDLAKKALEADKHVVVDKPFTVSSAEGFELTEIAESLGKILTVHHNRRWDSDFLTVRKIIEKGLLGRLVEAEIHYDRYRPLFRGNTWKEEDLPGTGILYDLGSHLIDQAQTLFGLPQAVTAFICTQRVGGKTPDSFEAVLHYPELKVTLKGGMLVREPLPHYILLGEKGSFIKYGMDVQEEDLKSGAVPSATNNWGLEPKTQWGKINTEINGIHLVGKIESEAGDYQCFYKNVLDAVLQNTSITITGRQAANTIKIIELAMKSQIERRTIEFH
jgi:predicted dehydrogenase